MSTLPRDNLVRALPSGLALRDDGDGSAMPTMVGHASVFNEWTEINSIFEGRFLERIAPGAFKKTVRENGGSVKVLLNHGHDPSVGDKPLGPLRSLREDGQGLAYEVDLLDTSYNRDIVPGLKAGLYGASFRFSVMKEEVREDPGPSDANPLGLPERTIKEVKLYELGPVTFPAYPQATAGIEGASVGMRSITDDYIVGRDPERIRALVDAQTELSSRDGVDDTEALDAPDEPVVDHSDADEPPADEDTDTDAPVVATDGDDDGDRAADTDVDGVRAEQAQETEAVAYKYGTPEEMRTRQDEIKSRMGEIDREYAGQALPDAERSEWDALDSEFSLLDDQIKESEARRSRLDMLGGESAPESRRLRGDGAGIQVATRMSDRDVWDLSAVRGSLTDPAGMARELKDRAMKAIEISRFPNERISREDAQTQVERLLEKDTKNGDLARRILTTGSPTYQRAFGKLLANAPLSEVERTALAIGSDGAGDYAVPFVLDPTVILTSNGQVNPLRQISRVVQITGAHEWRGVASAGITASYDAEAAEVSDDAPTFTQPTVSVAKAQAFVPFSIEIGEDFVGLQGELSAMLADAKDSLEADKFLNGTGTDQPQGLIEYLDDAPQSASWVDSGTYNAVSVPGDLFLLEEALPPRHRPLAAFLANKKFYNTVRANSTNNTYWERIGAGQPAELIGYPVYEASGMSSTMSAGQFVAVFGDFRNFLIVDRVGLNVEVIPHLFATANNRPSGQRGLYAYWRNGSGVLNANAFRILRVEPSS